MSIHGRFYPSKIYYSKYGGDSWYPENDIIVSGVAGSYNYRTKVFINTEDISDMKTPKYIYVQAELEQVGSPAGCYAVLATENITSSNSVVASSGDGPNSTLLQYAIAESYCYSDAECYIRVSGTNQGKGTKIYFKLDASQLKPNTEYYLYFLKQIAGTSTSTGFTSAKGLIITLDYEPSVYEIDLFLSENELYDVIMAPSGEYFTLPIPTKTGYKFLGWRDMTNPNSPLLSGTFIPSDAMRLMAVWEENKGSTIIYNNNGVAVECEVFYNNNGTAVRCDIFINKDGNAIQI